MVAVDFRPVGFTRIALILIAMLLAGCDLPKDPEGTSRSVENSSLDVGLLVDLGTFEGTSEQRTLQRIAEVFSAKILYHRDSPDRLLAALEAGDLDLLAGRLAGDSPLGEHTGMTRPVGTLTIAGKEKPAVFAVRQGENGFLLKINRVIARSPN